jgi:ABC-type lipoprotein export system ATPase subunit
MKSNSAEKMIVVSQLCKSYWNEKTKIKVLENISFSVAEGEVVAVMGPSGIGKSTLLNLLGTLDHPDSGTIEYYGSDPFQLPEREIARFRNIRIGFVFQFHHLLPEFTALENVMIPMMIYQSDQSQLADTAREMLTRVGLTHRLNHRPAQLSGGERQRVAVARALINNPLVVLADEPTGNLDLDNSNRLVDLMLELNQQYLRSFIIATHNPEIAARAHRTIYLKNKDT